MKSTFMSAAKLTKKQKKALAFRERKGKKAGDEDDLLAIPEADLAVEKEEISLEELVPLVPKERKKRKRDAEQEDKDDVTKRNSEDSKEETLKKKKKRKLENGEAAEVKEDGQRGEEAPAAKNATRYLLFVGELNFAIYVLAMFTYQRPTGNLKYTTPVEAIKEHFSKCGMFIPLPSGNSSS